MHNRLKSLFWVILHVFQLSLKHSSQVHILLFSLLNSDVLPFSGSDLTEGVIEEFCRSFVISKVRSYKLDIRLSTVTIYIKFSIEFVLGYVVIFTTKIKLMILLDQIDSILSITSDV